ncbi:hypothetical protein [Sphingobium sp. Z007]|uniref:hypothetical protein n=1 Tax=Sphingobium sp. Z007 TaxID=627495 RepID=UPI001124E3DD|nr:hypothetical protein [Sphingobium sp. Z007]
MLDGYGRDAERSKLPETAKSFDRAAWLIRAMAAALAQPAENVKGGDVAAMREAAAKVAESIYCVGDHLCRDEAASNIAKAIRALPIPAAEEKAAGIDLSREETCPLCEGREMASGEFCIAGCRNGIVLWTTANVLRNIKPWIDSDQRKIAELRQALSPAAHADVREAGQFLLDRLVDHEVRMKSENDAREWSGHVTPAMARFRAALSTPPAPLDEGEAK